MNTTLINELKSKCIVREQRGTTAFNNYMVDKFDTEKFAELIVKECVHQVLTGIKCNPPQAEPPAIAKTLAQRLQQHFGVEPDINENLRNRSTYFGNDI